MKYENEKVWINKTQYFEKFPQTPGISTSAVIRFCKNGVLSHVESANACLSYGFESLEFTEVKAFTRPDLNRARRGMDKLEADFLSYVDFHGAEGVAYLIKPNSIEF